MAGRRALPPAGSQPCLVALIGFGRGLRRTGYGILRRCGLDPVLLPDIDRALQVLGNGIAFDGLVLDLRNPATQGNLRRFLVLGQARPESALIILYQGRLTSTYRDWLHRAGARCLSSRDFTLRRLAWHIRTALGLSTRNHPCVERRNPPRTR